MISFPLAFAFLWLAMGLVVSCYIAQDKAEQSKYDYMFEAEDIPEEVRGIIKFFTHLIIVIVWPLVLSSMLQK